ncbi:unnamed protein product [Prunus armeniaca]|uniref:Non-haem dioxygenase N-terminal domain-containing protein n=1 Tax=Prunus armeniaca TaxID=36596 RepID=A0A6J5TCU4_PRUAR|nr:unnamed protein product [Prunus armeniaca]
MLLEESPSETSCLYFLLPSFEPSQQAVFCAFSRAFSATFLVSRNSFMIFFNWVTARLGSPSWALDLVLLSRRLDIAFPWRDVFGVPCVGSVILYDRFCKIPTGGANCWSKISFRKKYLHKYLTEVCTLLWLKKNSGSRSREQTMEMGTPSTTTVTQKLPGNRTWGFFQIANHGIPVDLLEELKGGIRGFFEQDTDVKKQFYTRGYFKPLVYNSNPDLYRAPPTNWRDTFMCYIMSFGLVGLGNLSLI